MLGSLLRSSQFTSQGMFGVYRPYSNAIGSQSNKYENIAMMVLRGGALVIGVASIKKDIAVRHEKKELDARINAFHREIFSYAEP